MNDENDIGSRISRKIVILNKMKSSESRKCHFRKRNVEKWHRKLQNHIKFQFMRQKVVVFSTK
jgi:hypothetical protein